MQKKKSKFSGLSLSVQSWGLICTSFACLLFWLPYPYTERHFLFNSLKYISLRPTLITGFFALGLVTCLYVRGIFTIKQNRLTFIAFLINLTLFATIFEIFLSPGREPAQAVTLSPYKMAFLSFSIATIIFGVRETAKTIILFLIAGLFFFRLKLVSDAMGIFGFFAFISMISGLYLQEAISPQKLKTEWRYLTGREHSAA